MSRTPFRVNERCDGTTAMTPGIRALDIRPPLSVATARPAFRPAAPPVRLTAGADRVLRAGPADELARTRAARPETSDEHAGADGRGVALITTATEAAAIAAGAHQIRTVDGRALRYPSQNLAAIESLAPDRPGQTHALERHVGTTLADNVARLTASPLLHAAGSYDSLADAQYATDETIANPGNQTAIGAFLADPGRLKFALLRVDLGRSVGSSTLQSDLAAGTPKLVPGTTATVVLIRDATFPEGYRVLTTYPDTRPPELDARGTSLA